MTDHRTTDRFAKGSGVYTCRLCTRKTRQTDPDATAAKCCTQCWEISGIENEVEDGCITAEEGAARIAQLNAEITAKGGKARK
jgi:hypothetical protein